MTKFTQELEVLFRFWCGSPWKVEPGKSNFQICIDLQIHLLRYLQFLCCFSQSFQPGQNCLFTLLLYSFMCYCFLGMEVCVLVRWNGIVKQHMVPLSSCANVFSKCPILTECMSAICVEYLPQPISKTTPLSVKVAEIKLR